MRLATILYAKRLITYINSGLNYLKKFIFIKQSHIISVTKFFELKLSASQKHVTVFGRIESFKYAFIKSCPGNSTL